MACCFGERAGSTGKAKEGLRAIQRPEAAFQRARPEKKKGRLEVWARNGTWTVERVAVRDARAHAAATTTAHKLLLSKQIR